MLKEFKYISYLLTIFGFIFFVCKYYFSENYKKKSFRSLSVQDDKIIIYNKKLKILKSDTVNIVEYLDNSFNKSKKKYKFWELLDDNEK